MLDDPRDEELYHLLLIGLSWLRQEMPDTLHRTGASVMRSTCRAGAFSEVTKTALSRNAKLIGLMMGETTIIKGRRPSKESLLDSIARSDRDLITLAPPGPFAAVGLLGPKGHGLVITATGMARARDFYGDYARHINREGFLRAWSSNARQMRAMHARLTRVGNDR